jgi:pantoate--beta-alanine ligase
VIVVRTVREVRAALAAHGGRSSAGLVPTMGALHAGHLSLLEAARPENEVVVMSLFVNPAQFDDGADLAAYPRSEEHDLRAAEEAGVDLVFAPARQEMYPQGFETWVELEHAGEGLEGDARPGHFRGVATVCLKLFNIIRPDRAYFGQKDAQQAVVVRRLVRDLDLDVDVRVLPIVRDEDGLALSSRNARLSPTERARALTLPRALEAGRAAFSRREDPVAAARLAFDGLEPDYVELLDLDGATILAAAARVGPVRLIDNVLLKGELP